MEEIRWSPVDMVVYPIIYRVSYMSGGAGSRPSTVSPSSSIQDSCSNHQKDPQAPGFQSPLLKWKLYHLWSFLSILESLIYVPCSKVVVCGMVIHLSIAILASWLIWAGCSFMFLPTWNNRRPWQPKSLFANAMHLHCLPFSIFVKTTPSPVSLKESIWMTGHILDLPPQSTTEKYRYGLGSWGVTSQHCHQAPMILGANIPKKIIETNHQPII